jgi:hypothetical protein
LLITIDIIFQCEASVDGMGEFTILVYFYFLERKFHAFVFEFPNTFHPPILHVVSEKKFFEISANQKLLWVLVAMLDDQSEQKVKIADKDRARNIFTPV